MLVIPSHLPVFLRLVFLKALCLVLLFSSAFINDLPSVLPADSVVLFADDTAIYIISSNLASLNTSLQQCVDAANLWMTSNGLRLNASKTKSMLIHSRRQKLETGLSIHVDGVTVEQVQVHKYLGVVLNDTLTLE